jgi:cytochrome P450
MSGNAVLILLGGYDTTSMGLTYAFYLLAKHQEIQDQLREEINSVGHKSQYLEMVCNYLILLLI